MHSSYTSHALPKRIRYTYEFGAGEGVISSLKLLPNGCIVPPSEGGLGNPPPAPLTCPLPWSVEVLSISGLTRTLGKVPRDFILLPSVNSTEHRYFALVANQVHAALSTASCAFLCGRTPSPSLLGVFLAFRIPITSLC